jgi:hypothetical protein
MKKVDYNAVFYGFTEEGENRLKNLDLYVNIIYKRE